MVRQGWFIKKKAMQAAALIAVQCALEYSTKGDELAAVFREAGIRMAASQPASQPANQPSRQIR